MNGSMNFVKKVPWSTFVIAIVLFGCLFIDFNFKKWKRQDQVIEHDIHWYYAYLPATFIYKDIGLSKSDYKRGEKYYLFWTVNTDDGKKLIKSTMGLAMMYAPFFFVAHGFTLLTDYPADGFSEPYKIFLLLSAVFYLFVGLDYVRKILRHYNFSDSVIAGTLLLIGLGTNLLCYSSQSAPMPHVYNFCLFSIFIYYTIQWYQSQSFKNTFVLGLLLGLISLIRPSNIIILIFFFLYNVSSFSEFIERVVFIFKNWSRIILISLLVFIVWIPQLMYWKKVTGHYLFYSYTDEGFSFAHPKILQGLFSFRKGWLLYTPMMGFALLGIFFLKDAMQKLRVPIVLFLVVNIYVIFSWWCWWYGGTYGQRSMIDSYALMAIPLASFVQMISAKKSFYRILFYSGALFFIWLNIFQTYQFEHYSLHWDGMTRELYFKQFGRLQKIPDYEKYVSYPDYIGARSRGQSKAPVQHDMFNGKKEINRMKISLQAHNGKYVSADRTLNNVVVANRDHAFEWETFSLIIFENNECAIQSSNNLFLCDEFGARNEITATRTDVGAWETFKLEQLENHFMAFKAYNGKYLSAASDSLSTGQLFASGVSVGEKEKFKVINK